MMEKTTAELTSGYIKDHPDIKNCLKKGLINYSSLSRMIARELGIEKTSSKEAILIAARRFKDQLKNETANENRIRKLLSNSELNIKSKVSVYIISKNIDFDIFDDIQKRIRKEYGMFYLLEGSESYTIITQERYSDIIGSRFKSSIVRSRKELVMINFKTTTEIEDTRGFLSYITSLFAENGVNIIEFLSCWTDTIFVISQDDLNRTIEFLKF